MYIKLLYKVIIYQCLFHCPQVDKNNYCKTEILVIIVCVSFAMLNQHRY